ncbi:MAG: hypothetical protein SH809_09720 [Rhodothermales bacterium]|nr:hypothetical protein [Rhodothermales bacterium]
MEASEVPNREELTPTPAGGAEGQPEGTSTLIGLRSLRRLRDRVQAAALEIQALRQENAALHQRIVELERSVRTSGDGGTPLAFEGDPDLLRRKVDGFIVAIDRYLEEDSRAA